MDEEQKGVPDVDLGEIVPKEKRPWLEYAKSGLLSGPRYGRLGLRYGRLGLRYGHLGLRYARRWGRRWGWPAVKWIAALSLPFFVLVRGSMYAYQSMGVGHLVLDRARHVRHGLGLFRVRYMVLAPHHRRGPVASYSAAGFDRRRRGLQHVRAPLHVLWKRGGSGSRGLLRVSASTHETRSQHLLAFRPKCGRHRSRADARRLPRNGSPPR